MAKSNGISEGGDVASYKEITVPLLDPVEWLHSVFLDKALLASYGRLEAVETPAGSRSAFDATSTGSTNRLIVLNGNDGVLDLVEMRFKLLQED